MQMNRIAIVILAAALLSCRGKTHLPIERKLIEIDHAPEEIICNVRKFSELEGLGFGYGTSIQPFGTMVTIRLFGDGFEITMTNVEKANEYDLRAYNKSEREQAGRLARLKFEKLKQRVVVVPQECRSR